MKPARAKKRIESKLDDMPELLFAVMETPLALLDESFGVPNTLVKRRTKVAEFIEVSFEKPANDTRSQIDMTSIITTLEPTIRSNTL